MTSNCIFFHKNQDTLLDVEKSSKLNFVLLNKPKSKDNLPIRLIGRYISFLLKTTQPKVIIWSFC